MTWIYRVVTEGDPRQYRFAFALWTARVVGEVIRRQFGIRLSHASVCRLPGQLGLSTQRPLWRAYQQDPAKIEQWMREGFPAIRAQAKRQGRFGLNLISAVSRQGPFRFMHVAGRVNAGAFIEFLRRLIHNSRQMIFLIVDGHPSHTAAKVKAFLATVALRLRLYFLPPYAPELNPDEFALNDLKNKALGRTVLTGPDHMKSVAISHLHFLQKSPALVRSFFHAPSTAYAARCPDNCERISVLRACCTA